MFYTIVQNCSALLVLYCASDKDADSVTNITESTSQKKSDSPLNVDGNDMCSKNIKDGVGGGV